MIRAGLIRNLRSHRNQGGARARLPTGVLEIVPEEPRELAGALQRFAADGADLVIIDGGDGTVREVISRLPEAFGGRLPRLAVVPSGKTNALALDIGVPLGTPLDALIRAAEAGGPPKRRHCLEVVRPGQAAPEKRGFILGLGAFVRATELAQKSHGLGFFDNAAIVVTVAASAARTLIGGPRDPWRRGEAARLSLGPAENWFLVMASTLKRLPLGLKPFGEPREGLKVLSVTAPPKQLPRAIPVLISGRDAAWLEGCGYRRDDLLSFDVETAGAFVLDGEIYPGGAFTVRRGPELAFVVP